MNLSWDVHGEPTDPAREIKADLRGVAIAPEIQAWVGFSLDGRSQSLQDRMIYTRNLHA